MTFISNSHIGMEFDQLGNRVPRMRSMNGNVVFVFGSNEAGRHGLGAAKLAREKFGAVYGVGVGLRGNSYAIPTKDAELRILPLERIAQYVADFVEFAKNHPELEFNVVEVGCGLARPKHQTREQRVADIAPMFAGALELSNVFLPKAFGGKYINSKLGLDSDDWRSEEGF